MQVEITARHCELPQPLKKRVETRMEKLLRFDDRIMDARLVVSLERNRYNAEAIVLANGLRLVSHAEEDTDRSAVESVLDRMEKQVRRNRARMTKRPKKATAMGQMAGGVDGNTPVAAPEEPQEEYEAFGDASDYDGIVSEDPGDVSVQMEMAEAVAMLRASRRDSLGFTNAATGHPSIIYKRRDGNIGIVDLNV